MAEYADSIKVFFYLSGSWTDVSSDVLSPINAQGGIRGNKATDLLAGVGTLTFQLNNSTGKYSPDGSSPLAGWGKGVPVKVEFIYEGVTYVKPRAYVSKITIDPGVRGPRRVSVTCSDWFEYATKYPLVTPEISLNQGVEAALDTIVDAMPIAPQGTDYDGGINIFPTVFDAVGTKTTAYSEMARLVNSEIGYIFLKRDRTNGETLTFENATARSGLETASPIPKNKAASGFLQKPDGGYILLSTGGKIIVSQTETVSIDNTMMAADITYGDNVINKFTATAHPKRVDTELAVLFSLQRPILIGPGETKTFRVNYSDPNGGRPVNAITSTMIQPAAPGTDTSVVSYLRMNGVDASTTFTDEVGKTWTAVGNAQIDTASYKFGGASGNFDGTGDYITTPSHADFEMGSGDFTFEWWERRDSATGAKAVFARDNAASFPAFVIGVSDGTNLHAWFSKDGFGIDVDLDFGAIVTGSWISYAVCRVGSNWYAFRNGSLVDTATSSITLLSSSTVMTIGRYSTVGDMNGHIDEVRISKGRGRYTASYSVATAEFTYPELTGGDFSANTSSTGDGTDITSDITISAVYGSESIIYTASNANAAPAYLTVQARGFGVYQFDSVEANADNSVSYNEFGYQTDSLNQPYQQDISSGQVFANSVVALENQPRTVLNHITMNANRSGSAMEAFLNIDIGDVVEVIEDQTGVTGLYYVNGWDFTLGYNGIINYGWTLRNIPSLQSGLSPLAIECDASSTDGILFGYLPQVTNLDKRTICAWIYLDTVALGDQSIVCIGGSGDNGVTFRITTNQLRYFSERTITTQGAWLAGVLSASTLYHVAVTHDISTDVTSDPIIYKNGTAQSLSETSTPAGSKAGENGAQLVIGNIKTVTNDWTIPLDGKIKDVRIYNRILTPAEISTIYNSGTPSATIGTTDGLVFQAPCVRTGELASYTDVALSSTQNVLDNVYGVAGIPHGTPTGRAF